jgi:hypothetical protein
VTVALGANGLNGGAFSGIQDPKLEGRLVGKNPHGPAHRINFPNNMSFANSSH